MNLRRVLWVALALLAVSALGAWAGGQGDTAAKAEGPLEMTWMTGLFEAVPDMNNAWWTEFQKKTNTKVTIEWVPSGDYGAKMDLRLASGDLPEVMTSLEAARPTLIKAIQAGAFWELTPVLGDFSKYPNLKNNMTPGAWNYLRVNGKLYSVPRCRPQIDVQIKFRKDWLDQLGIAVPTTFEEYRQALKKIVNTDVDGNGKLDTLGLVGEGFLLGDSHANLMAGFGALDWQTDDQGGQIYNYLKDSYIDMVEYLRTLYADNAIPKEFSAMKRLAVEELFASGKAASYSRNIWRDYFFEEKIRKTQPKAEVISLPPLKNPKGGQTALLATGIYGAQYISKKVPQAKMLRIMDYFEKTANEEYLYMVYYGIEGIHYNMKDGVRVMTDQGLKEVGTSVQQITTLMKNDWAKVVYPGAPKAYNDQKLKEAQIYGKLGRVNAFELLVSDTWTQIWPTYQNEFESNTIKTIVGQMSVADYRAYVQRLRAMPEFKKAFQEFAAQKKDKFPNG
jgi:putative aldouronate transport system substrate-binding protein